MIKIFDGGSSNEVEKLANDWLEANPDIEFKTASIHEMHDNYTYGECLICNQWISLVIVCEKKTKDHTEKNLSIPMHHYTERNLSHQFQESTTGNELATIGDIHVSKETLQSLGWNYGDSINVTVSI